MIAVNLQTVQGRTQKIFTEKYMKKLRDHLLSARGNREEHDKLL